MYIHRHILKERKRAECNDLKSTFHRNCVLFPAPGENTEHYGVFSGSRKAVETILVMTDAEETPERMQNIIKKYIPDGQKAKAIVMERSDGEDWNSFRRRFAACRI